MGGTITVKEFTYTDNMRYTALYLLFTYFWTSEFIVAMGQVRTHDYVIYAVQYSCLSTVFLLCSQSPECCECLSDLEAVHEGSVVAEAAPAAFCLEELA